MYSIYHKYISNGPTNPLADLREKSRLLLVRKRKTPSPIGEKEDDTGFEVKGQVSAYTNLAEVTYTG